MIGFQQPAMGIPQNILKLLAYCILLNAYGLQPKAYL